MSIRIWYNLMTYLFQSMFYLHLKECHSYNSKNLQLIEAWCQIYMYQWTLVQATACDMFVTKPLSGPMLMYYQLDPRNKRQWNLNHDMNIFIQETAFEIVISKISEIWFHPQHCNGNVFILMKFSSLAALKVVKMQPVMKISLKWQHFHFSV